MKVGRLCSVSLKRNVIGLSFYSTTTTQKALKQSTKEEDELFSKIVPIRRPTVSIVPVLDQWIQQGRTVTKAQLQSFIKFLKRDTRHTHALQISLWMSDKRFFELSSSDVAVRLDLISKVHGIEQAENYFSNIPEKLIGPEVYGALLNCYALVKSVQKAETVMQKMRNLGFVKTSLSYNALLNLYYQTGYYEKLDPLMIEMEEKGIDFDRFTITIRLSAYAAACDIEGLEEFLTWMESNPRVVLDWASYAVAANGYRKAGNVDKALAMLKKSEGLIYTAKPRTIAFDFLLTQYAATGKKDEVLRVWELYKKEHNIDNKGYISIITSLLKFDDIESAEKILEEWESSNLTHGMRIPNYLIGAYCRKGLVEKAENLLNREILKGGEPNTMTWYGLATGYLQTNQTAKAVEAMKEALLICWGEWKPSNKIVAVCLDYLNVNGDVRAAEDFIKLLRRKDIISEDVSNRLLNYIKDGKSNSHAQ